MGNNLRPSIVDWIRRFMTFITQTNFLKGQDHFRTGLSGICKMIAMSRWSSTVNQSGSVATIDIISLIFFWYPACCMSDTT